MDVNGSLRPIVMKLDPAKYIGVDLAPGRGVDEVCASETLVQRFGADSFDLVMSTEMLEHVLDWRKVLHNLKQVLKPGGVLIITTRSKGYPLHGYPSDYWRYEISDFQELFRDFAIEVLMSDPTGGPGVFLRARKPIEFLEAKIDDWALYSVVSRRRIKEIRFQKSEEFWFKIRLWLTTQALYLAYFVVRLELTSAYLASRLIPRPIRQAIRKRFVDWKRRDS
jgi:SAM-dependent methyltransferase